MFRYFTEILFFTCAFSSVSACGQMKDYPALMNAPPAFKGLMEEAIAEFEQHAGAEMSDEENEIMIQLTALERIQNLMHDPTHVYNFIEAKGISRVINPHLRNYNFNTVFHIKLLNMLIRLFEIAPTTTSKVIPMDVVDKLLEIYEEEDALVLKGKVIEILHAWLPGNPKVQARIMKMKGLDVFYEQVHKLDATIIETKLKLFSKILKEHLKVRQENAKDTKADMIRTHLYTRIGLIERVGTHRVCTGLMNIFHSFVDGSGKFYMSPILDILIELQPFCMDHFVKQTKAAQFFRELEKHVKEMNVETKLHYEMHGISIPQLEDAVDSYVGVMKAAREEF